MSDKPVHCPIHTLLLLILIALVITAWAAVSMQNKSAIKERAEYNRAVANFFAQASEAAACQTALNDMPNGIVSMDENFSILVSNDAFERLSGRSETSMIGNRLDKMGMFDPAFFKMMQSVRNESIEAFEQGNLPVEKEQVIRFEDGGFYLDAEGKKVPATLLFTANKVRYTLRVYPASLIQFHKAP